MPAEWRFSTILGRHGQSLQSPVNVLAGYYTLQGSQSNRSSWCALQNNLASPDQLACTPCPLPSIIKLVGACMPTLGWGVYSVTMCALPTISWICIHPAAVAVPCPLASPPWQHSSSPWGFSHSSLYPYCLLKLLSHPPLRGSWLQGDNCRILLLRWVHPSHLVSVGHGNYPPAF